ncbi:MAG: hypothetical protein GC184_14555 [Rhizobiales bacterium]|nr:hypothetical protein [Hyphomicrobiales bacterium]
MSFTFAEMAKPFLEEWGWAIFPVSRNKMPLIKGGCHAASTMPDQIEEWAEAFPWANVGLACGGANGIAVLDVDFPAGVESLRQIFASGFEPFGDTIEVATPSGGRHYYFIQPDVTLKNRAGHIAPGLDIRSAGGSIIAPPSMHKSGRRYEWVNSPSRFCLDGLVTPAPMPYWLKMKASAEKLPRPQVRQLSAPAKPHTIIDMEEAELRRARPGTRNYALNKAAFVFGQFAAQDCISEDAAASRLLAAALAIGLTAGESEPTIRSGFAAGLSQPRQGR